MALSAVVVERIETVEALERLGPEWRRLADAHAGGLPFRTFEWNAAWWRHLRSERFQVRDVLFARAFRTPEGALVGVAPLRTMNRPSEGPLRLRAVEPFGADPNVTELRGLLCAPEWEGPVHAALLDDLSRCADSWDWVTLRGLREGHGERFVRAREDAELVDETTNYVLPLPASWEELKATRSRNLKESLRKCYNSLKRDGHAFTFEVARTPAEVAVAIDRFRALHRLRAEVADGVSHPNVFAERGPRAFLSDLCGQLAARGIARVYQLRVRDQVVATRIGFAMGDTLYLYFSGYDPAWARYSVMTTTVAETLKDAIAEGFRFANLSNGTDVSKTRWDPVAVRYHDAVVVSPSWRGRVAHRAYEDLRRGWMGGRLRTFAKGLLGRSAAGA
jgi:CelD/BcsL family acetyltransferase involved in cellulose biosynthesis